MKKITVLALLLIFITSAFAQSKKNQNVVGNWETKIKVGESFLPLIFHIEKKDNGFKGTYDSPAEEQFNIELTKIEFVNGILEMETDTPPGSFKGKFDAKSGTIIGELKSDAFTGQVTLTREVTKKETKIDNKIAGDWETAIKFDGGSLKIVFHIIEKDGKLSGTWDSPDQNAFGLKIKELAFDGQALKIADSEFQFSFIGEYDKQKDVVKGKFEQGELSTDFTLTRAAKK